MNCAGIPVVSTPAVEKEIKSSISTFLSREWRGGDIFEVSLFLVSSHHLVLNWLPGHSIFSIPRPKFPGCLMGKGFGASVPCPECTVLPTSPCVQQEVALCTLLSLWFVMEASLHV